MEQEQDTGPKKRRINFSEEEILLLLRSFIASPYNWTDIISLMKDNIHHLPERGQDLYSSLPPKLLQERCQLKLARLLTMPDERLSANLRPEMTKVRQIEAEMSQVPGKQGNAALPEKPTAADKPIDIEPSNPGSSNSPPKKKFKVHDIRDEMLKLVEPECSDDDLHVNKEHTNFEIVQQKTTNKKPKKTLKKKKKKKSSKKKSAFQLSKENNIRYAKFMETTIPKLMKIWGVESSDSASDSDSSSSEDDD